MDGKDSGSEVAVEVEVGVISDDGGGGGPGCPAGTGDESLGPVAPPTPTPALGRGEGGL